MLMEFHKDAWFMQRDEQDVIVKAKNVELSGGALSLFQEEHTSKDQHVVDAHGMVHHQWRPPEAVDDLPSYDAKVESMQEFLSEPKTW